MPSYRRAPIMARDYRLPFAERVQQPHHVANELEECVLLDCFWLIGPAVATHVRRHRTKPSGRKSGELMTPRVPTFRESMAQHDQRAITLLREMKSNAVRLDRPMCDVFGHSRLGHDRADASDDCRIATDAARFKQV